MTIKSITELKDHYLLPILTKLRKPQTIHTQGKMKMPVVIKKLKHWAEFFIIVSNQSEPKAKNEIKQKKKKKKKTHSKLIEDQQETICSRYPISLLSFKGKSFSFIAIKLWPDKNCYH